MKTILCQGGIKSALPPQRGQVQEARLLSSSSSIFICLSLIKIKTGSVGLLYFLDYSSELAQGQKVQEDRDLLKGWGHIYKFSYPPRGKQSPSCRGQSVAPAETEPKRWRTLKGQQSREQLEISLLSDRQRVRSDRSFAMVQTGTSGA